MRGYRVFHIIVIMLALTACTADHEAMRQRLQYVSDCNRADTVFTEQWLPTVDSLVSYFDPSSRSWLERFFSLPFRATGVFRAATGAAAAPQRGANPHSRRRARKGVGSNDRMMAHYVRGRVYHDMGEAPQALECYQKAAEQADTTRSDCDFLQLSRIYAQTAHLFLQQNLPENAISVLAKACHYAMIAQDSV
ncbi:MAG: tetratricopeptide repeat protein, partial [Prevotella sp.]|nr:tetratricopeptide repeat protein [Prevotella sp.]